MKKTDASYVIAIAM